MSSLISNQTFVPQEIAIDLFSEKQKQLIDFLSKLWKKYSFLLSMGWNPQTLFPITAQILANCLLVSVCSFQPLSWCSLQIIFNFGLNNIKFWTPHLKTSTESTKLYNLDSKKSVPNFSKCDSIKLMKPWWKIMIL